ncbi:MAG: acyltransferase family protein, partial [Clostridia bacterium]|nr:acyltransferase family protein [Clostridia bacterium]MBR2973569.1 acyltransferase family protein [Clostridia bacterium]
MKRNYGIDALRIVSIFMVIILHVMAQGAAIYSVDKGSANYYIFWFLEMASFCAVNCFALVSGYVGYGRKKKLSSIISLSAQALFYVIVFTAAGCIAKGAFDKDFVLASLLAVREGGFWYFKAYLCAWFFFPLIDIAVEKLERKQLKRMVTAGFIFFSVVPLIFFADLFRTGLGYTPLWLLVMYFYGAYVKKYGIEENKKPLKYFLLFLLMSVITWAGVIAIKSVEGKAA